MMGKEVVLPYDKRMIVASVLDNSYKSLEVPKTVTAVKDHLEGLTVHGNTDLAIGLFHTIVTHRTRAKQDGAAKILELQLGEADEHGFYPVSKVQGDLLATSVIELLDAYKANGRMLNKEHTRELVTSAVAIVYPYIPGDEDTQKEFIEKAKAANVLSAELDTSEEAIKEKAERQEFLRVITDHPQMSATLLASVLGIASYAAYHYLRRFKNEGVLPAERESEIWDDKVKRSIVYVSSALKDYALRFKPEVVEQKEATNTDHHEKVEEKEEPTVIFERSKHGKLYLKTSDILARSEVFLRYLIEHDQAPVHAVAKMLGLSRNAGYKYYNLLRKEGRLPANKLRKSGQRKKEKDL